MAARTSLLMAHMSLADKIAEMYVDPGAASGPYAGYEGYVPPQPALCIPALVEQDGPSGVAYGAPDATQLPPEVSLASSWDPTLAYQYGALNGLEHLAKGIAVTLGPGVNIQRDPRWGRNFEMFSEDPLLTSVLGVADTEGIQSQGELADVKHFVVYNQETYRDTPLDNVIISPRALHEIYLPPFYAAATQAGAASIMCAYPLLNGQFSCQDPSLLQGILYGSWAFTGFVRSDGGANQSTVASANAGLDQEHGSYYWDNGQLAAQVTDGQVGMATINQAVRRILNEMFRFNLFNNPPTGTQATPVDTPTTDQFALEVAERGTVLLKNQGSVLPLNAATTGSIAVIGPDGSTAPLTAGGGSSHVSAPYVVSPLAGITNRLGAAGTVTSYAGTDPTQAAATAAAAKVAIVFASEYESEGSDLKNISLSAAQNAMIAAVAAANPDTIVVLNTGGPVLMPWLGAVKAVLEAWYPGQEDGNAIAAVLFGDVDPGGHLPETFPTSLAAIPTASPSQFPGVDGEVHYSEGLDVGYRWYDAHHVTPLFPFGYGLSYTTFKFSNLKLAVKPINNPSSGPQTPTGQSSPLAHVSAQITNTGAVAGSDVMQLYVGDPTMAKEPPRQLEAFRSVELAPGQSRTVHFTLSGHELSFFNTKANGWTVPTGHYAIYVGDSSALGSLPLRGTLTIRKTIGARYAILRAPANVVAGSSFQVSARFVNHGGYPIIDGTVRLHYPAGWTVVRMAKSPLISLRAGQTVTRNFRVTAPRQAEGNVTKLTATLVSLGVYGAGDLNAETTVTVARPVTLSFSPSVAVAPGTQATVTISVASHINHAVTVVLGPVAPAGVTITPAAPSVRVGAHGTASLQFAVSVASGTAPASDAVALNPTFTEGRATYQLAIAELTVAVPYQTLADAFNSTAVSDDTAVGSADFDGAGNSYSAQALEAIGLTPGVTLTADGVDVQWPDVPAGTPDNVTAEGQTILLDGSGLDTQLSIVGASAGADESGIGTIQYTDGTVQPFTLTLDNWFNGPDTTGEAALATAAYINSSTGVDNNGVIGRRDHQANIFAVSIPLTVGKTVVSVTLPMVGTLPGVFPMHIFAVGVGAPA
ncbi:MAG: glycoside hydrolase family 3 C-terminal domain-containing protein [Solirubrobacteraceae bacterium]